MKIYLTGFMGAGKTWVGRALASQLNFRFLDLDEWLEAGEGKTVASIFSEAGEPAFRKLEAEYLRATARFSNTVIATGGGTPCFFENMDWMNHNGITVYLQASPVLLAARLRSEKESRPLLAGLDDGELPLFIQKKISDRAVFYQQAHLQLEVLDDMEVGIAEMAAYLKRFIQPG